MRAEEKFPERKGKEGRGNHRKQLVQRCPVWGAPGLPARRVGAVSGGWGTEDGAAPGPALLPAARPQVNLSPTNSERGRHNCFANKHLMYLFPLLSSHISSPPLNGMPPGFT